MKMAGDNKEILNNLELCLENVIEPLLQEDTCTTICDQFQELRNYSENLKKSNMVKCEIGEKETNKKKNRYGDILPFDHNRVILKDFKTSSGAVNDYINASWIKGIDDTFTYIASQGPMPNTVLAFWHMIWDCKTDTIIMACKTEENNKKKCQQYWPEKVGGIPMQYGFVIVKLISESQINKSCIVRELEVADKNNKELIRCMKQYHYTAWPDYGAPRQVDDLNSLLECARSNHKTGPILVHCSAGVGRTGAICALDYCWSLIKNGEIKSDTSIYKIVENLRNQRQSMVQSADQLVFLYKSVKRLFVDQIAILRHIYENDKPDIPPIPPVPNTEDSSGYELVTILKCDDVSSKNTETSSKKDEESISQNTEHLQKDKNSITAIDNIYSIPNKLEKFKNKSDEDMSTSGSNNSLRKKSCDDNKDIQIGNNSLYEDGFEPSCVIKVAPKVNMITKVEPKIPKKKVEIQEPKDEPLYADIVVDNSNNDHTDSLSLSGSLSEGTDALRNRLNRVGTIFKKLVNPMKSENTYTITEKVERIQPVTIIACGQNIDISYKKTVGKLHGPVSLPKEFI